MKNPPVVEKITLRYGDLDPYGHVNNAMHVAYFEALRMAYWNRLAEHLGLGSTDAGDIPGARYVIAEATIRYRAPIFFEDSLFGAISIHTIGNRSWSFAYELRVGETFQDGRIVAEGESAQAFFDPETGEVQPRPEWFLQAVAEIEGKPEESLTQGRIEGGR